jgi:hypothetical protein
VLAISTSKAGTMLFAADPALSFSTGQIFGATGGGGQPA